MLLTKTNTIITFEGSRLQPRDVLGTSQPTHVGTSHTWVSGNRGEPDEQTNQMPETPTEASADLL